MTEKQPQIPTLGKLIDGMLRIKDQRSELAKQYKDLGVTYDDLELDVLTRLLDEDTTQGRSHTATATVATLTVPVIEDWAAFEQYIYDNNALYMMEKRPSGAAFRELISQGETIPGLQPFVKTTISLRRL